MFLITKLNINATNISHYFLKTMLGLLILASAFYLSSRNYLLFHTVIELFTVLVAFGIMVLAVHTHNYQIHNNSLFIFLGVAYGFIGFYDLIHALAYSGMGVFPGNTANLATQLWIVPRYMESITFLLTALLIEKSIKPCIVFVSYLAFTIFTFYLVFTGEFPVCFVGEEGLTDFKIISEYVICIILVVAIFLLFKKIANFDNDVFCYIILACLTNICAELCFTLYISISGIQNLLGHLLRLLSYFFIYKAIIEKGLKKPYLELKNLNIQLKKEIEERNKAEKIQKKMENELNKISRLNSLGTLASGLAHDFNNMLAIIIGNVTLAKKSIVPKDKLYKRLIEIEKASLEAKELTQQLLTFSRGGLSFKEKTNITELIWDVVHLALSGSEVLPEFSIPNQPFWLYADKGQIKQVINNLVINAVQAMPQGGVIKVSISEKEIADNGIIPLKPGKYLLLKFQDEGIGIPNAQIEEIFDPFFTTKEAGNGLGLTTVYSIVKKHDGYLTLSSELGKGTTFFVYLPLVKEEMVNNGGGNQRKLGDSS